MLKKIAIIIVLMAAAAFLWLNRDPGPGDGEWRRFLREGKGERFARMEGYRIRYVDYGRGDPVLLVHGFADSSYTWHRNIRPLAGAGFRVIAVDFPGMGGSGAPKDFSYRPGAIGEELLRFMDGIGIPRFHVIGNSMGGGIALYLAIRRPGRIKKAVLVDPAWTADAGFRIGAVIGSGKMRRFMLKAAGPWSVRLVLRDIYARPQRIDDRIVGEYVRIIERPDFADNASRLVEGYFSPELAALEKEYGTLRVPCLVIWGAKDRWIAANSETMKLSTRLKGATQTVIGDAGHVPHQELPVIFNPLVVTFLKSGFAAAQ